MSDLIFGFALLVFFACAIVTPGLLGAAIIVGFWNKRLALQFLRSAAVAMVVLLTGVYSITVIFDFQGRH